MTNSGIFIVALVILATSCNSYPLPKSERCTILSNLGTCTDERLPEGEKEYDKSFRRMLGYQCTNVTDYNRVAENIIDIRKKLVICKRKLAEKNNR